MVLQMGSPSGNWLILALAILIQVHRFSSRGTVWMLLSSESSCWLLIVRVEVLLKMKLELRLRVSLEPRISGIHKGGERVESGF